MPELVIDTCYSIIHVHGSLRLDVLPRQWKARSEGSQRVSP